MKSPERTVVLMITLGILFPLGLSSACRPKGSRRDRVTLTSVTVRVALVPTWPQGIFIPQESQVRAWFEKAAEVQHSFVVATSTAKGGPLDYVLVLAVDAQQLGETSDVAVRLQARATSAAERRPFESVWVLRLRRGQATDAQERALRGALGELANDVGFQAGLETANDRELIDGLSKQKGERLALTIEALARRRAAGAARALMVLLKHPDPGIRDRAIGALVSIGDRSAVGALTRLAQFSDTETLAKLIDGIAALGGDEAASYLDFLASGHPDEDIREMARVARQRLPQ